MIGLFDSGVGGLFALRQLRACLPQADLCYFGDTANLPYGEKDPHTLLTLSHRAIAFLRAQGAGAILCACGTVSATVLPLLQQQTETPLFGILSPLCAAVADAQQASGGRIALLATRATVKQGQMAACLSHACGGATVLPLPCQPFVQLAEQGEMGYETVRATLSPLLPLAPRVVALGCTHFSALRDAISKALPGAAIIDGAEEAARAATHALPSAAVMGRGQTRLYTSGDPAAFAAAAERILGCPVQGRPERKSATHHTL